MKTGRNCLPFFGREIRTSKIQDVETDKRQIAVGVETLSGLKNYQGWESYVHSAKNVSTNYCVDRTKKNIDILYRQTIVSLIFSRFFSYFKYATDEYHNPNIS